jgi:hypothetical protein
MLATIVAGAVAAFGIYTWGWRDDGKDGDGDARLARAYAESLPETTTPPCLESTGLAATRGVCELADVEAQ